jgi:hypothetical protein
MRLSKAALAVAVCVSSGCASAAPETQVVERPPVAISEDGQPIFQLTEDELIIVFRDVQVLHSQAYPPVAESFRAGGRYSAGGQFLDEGRFWAANGELCARVEGQTGGTLCRRFGRSPDGAIYEISGSRGNVSVPYKYNMKPIPDGTHQ